MQKRFWTWVYGVLWYAADWVLTSRLDIPASHPVRVTPGALKPL